jgi:hypothetical protein
MRCGWPVLARNGWALLFIFNVNNILDRTSMKASFIRFALISTLLGANGALASTPCVQANAKGSVGQALYIKRDDLKPGRVLLGLDGSRVVVRRTLAPEPGKQTWYARVDWEKYQIAPSHSPAIAVLRLDADEKGRRYLCSIETRDYTDAYVERSVGNETPAAVRPEDIEVIELTQFAYDAHHRLIAAIESQRDAEQRKLKPTSTACFHYDAKDRFLGASFSDAGLCAQSGSEQIQDRYVYQADGVLLRKISIEKSTIGLDGNPFVTNVARVTVFGPQGQPMAEYVHGDSGRRYRRSLALKANDSKYHAIKVVGSPASLDLNSLQDGKAAGLWQLFSMPSSVANANDGLYDDRYLVARDDKLDIDRRQRERIWKALSRPDQDMVLVAQGVFLLVPEVSTAIWAACMNPRLDSRAACP